VRNVLTIDIEEYFHVSAFERVIPPSRWRHCESRVEASVDRLLALLDTRRVRATFFVLGWVAQERPALVRRIAEQGHEIGCHSFAHRRIYTQSRAEFAEDVRRAKATIEDAIGAGICGYRAPSFSIVQGTLWALDVVAEFGFTYDSSIFPIRHDRYGIATAPRGPHRVRTPAGAEIWELPPATVSYLGARVPVAGGGYLRHLPPAVLWWGIGRLNRVDGLPAILYVHPWELDPGQPRQPVGRLATWRHYGNLAKTEARLVELLARFEFGTASDLLERLPVATGRPLIAGRPALERSA
jgi:polysaccharide deacetylase family protein (PEP-CTERM system associated)